VSERERWREKGEGERERERERERGAETRLQRRLVFESELRPII
jgi:hypothetical protein